MLLLRLLIVQMIMAAMSSNEWLLMVVGSSSSSSSSVEAAAAAAVALWLICTISFGRAWMVGTWTLDLITAHNISTAAAQNDRPPSSCLVSSPLLLCSPAIVLCFYTVFSCIARSYLAYLASSAPLTLPRGPCFYCLLLFDSTTFSFSSPFLPPLPLLHCHESLVSTAFYCAEASCLAFLMVPSLHLLHCHQSLSSTAVSCIALSCLTSIATSAPLPLPRVPWFSSLFLRCLTSHDFPYSLLKSPLFLCRLLPWVV